MNENEEQEVAPIKLDLSKLTESMTANLASAEPIIDLNREYLKLEQGKPIRFIFTGTTEMVNSDTGEMTSCVVLMDGKKKLFIYASHVVYNACKDLPMYSGIEIEYTGDKKLTGGKNLKEHRITLLNS